MYFRSWLSFFILWWIILIPIEFNICQPLINAIHFPFYRFAEWIAGTNNFQSDSYGMYALLAVAAIVASLSTVIFLSLSPGIEKLRSFTVKSVSWYLALILFKYGWIKIIGLQFYLPEPNIVYRDFGMLSKDIAWWSLMGTSSFYSTVTGIAEILAAFLLLIPRTRFAGAIISAGIFANVLLINLSFDISVKLFSASLLFFSLLIVASFPNILRAIFQQRTKDQAVQQVTDFRGKKFLKLTLLCLIFVECLYPGFTHDSNLPRNKFHGAHRLTGSIFLSRVYVHRKDFLILEDHSGNQLDYKMEWEGSSIFRLDDPRSNKRFTGYWKNNRFFIEGITPDTLKTFKLPYHSLPLFREKIHLLSDQFH